MSSSSAAAAAVSADQKEDLKHKVREKLKELGVDKQIHELVAAKAGPVGTVKPAVSREEAITQLKGKGVLDQLVKSLATTGTGAPDGSSKQRNAVQLRLREITGLGFYAKKPPEQYEQLVVCAELYGQRLRSPPVAAAASAQMEAALAAELPRGLQSSEQLLLQKQPLHLVLMRTFPHAAENVTAVDLERHNLESEVLGSVCYDWREAWCSPGQTRSLELPLVVGGTARADCSGGAVVGTLHLDVTAQASQDSSMAGLQLAAQALQARQAEEQEGHAQALDVFRSLAEAISTQGNGKDRQLVMAGEDGRLLPVCSFVRPLQLGRCLASAQQACHFVSLIEPKLEWDADVYPGPVGPFFASPHTILAAGLASAEEKAVLLCSLLQGFGMDAYIAIGSHKHSPGERLWVTTLAGGEVLFWDPVSGHRSSPRGQANGKPCSFLAVDLLFSHRRLYANLQTGQPLAATSFALDDAACWREVVVPPTAAPALPAQRYELQRPLLDTVTMEAKLEACIKQLLAVQRAQLLGSSNAGSSITWDDSLAFLLMPTLAALERDAIWAEDTLAPIKRAMPGATLLGVQHHSRCLVAPRIVRALLREHAARDVLATSSSDAAFALRVRVVAHPEHTSSCWLMLAVRSSQPGAAPAAP